MEKDLNNTWVKWWKEATKSSEILRKLEGKRRPGPEKDALFDGYWELKKKAEYHAKEATNRGGLLLLVLP